MSGIGHTMRKRTKILLIVVTGLLIIQWNAAGMTWWAVSDLNRNELRDFEQLLKGQPAPATVH